MCRVCGEPDFDCFSDCTPSLISYLLYNCVFWAHASMLSTSPAYLSTQEDSQDIHEILGSSFQLNVKVSPSDSPEHSLLISVSHVMPSALKRDWMKLQNKSTLR